MLIARIYPVFPRVCQHCGTEMRLIAFYRDRLGDPQPALRHPVLLGCPGHAFPGMPARRGEGSPDLRLSPVSPSSTSASPPKRLCSHPRALRRPGKRLTRPRPLTRSQRHQSLASSLTRPSSGSAATACAVQTLRPLRGPRRSLSSPACSAWLSHKLGGPFLLPRATFPPRLLHSPTLDPRLGSAQP